MQVQGFDVTPGGVVELFPGIGSRYLSGVTAQPPRALLSDLATLRERAAESADGDFDGDGDGDGDGDQ